MLRVLSLLFLVSFSGSQRWNPNFNMIPDGGSYKQYYDAYMREVDQDYARQKNYLMQQPGYADQNRQMRQNLMENYRQYNPRTDEFGNLIAGEGENMVFLTCNGQGCAARG